MTWVLPSRWFSGMTDCRSLLWLLILPWMAVPWPGSTWADDRPVFRISGPPIAESLPFAMMSGMTFDNPAMTVRFIPWNSPDQIRAMIAGGQVEGAIITTASASLFYNRGVRIRLAALFETSLWIVSTADSGDTGLNSLTGTILFPFGHREMPELIFNVLMGPQSSELTRHHTGGALEAVNLLLLGRGHHALLAEPAASLALVRSGEMAAKGVPALIKHLDLRTLWEQKFLGKPLYVSGFAVIGDTLANPAMVHRILLEYEKGLVLMADHPERALAMAQKNFPALAAQSDNGSLPGGNIRITRGQEAFSDTLFFLNKLSEQAPRAMGGPLPGEDFFLVTQ
ncbi:hypothetical protein OOT00_05870 [Desulfobotulus sp. H1]|uniref:ABC transporter substrate-binding protein n=1 Tax=Desulfobotulus pelophilus TaxID=2823377 RepID=A0ABT3N7T1_9BACT|nr:hypothetical protein [Desulfobotulus pelophilus]MCW7753514.1 hypothetical protein [Desulfobotulus pelophilus]